MKAHRAFIAILFSFSLAACASGPTFSEVQPQLTGPSDEMGRIFFYRTSILGAAIQPPVYLNDEEVGHCVPGGVFYKDVEPGKYRVRLETEVERQLTFTVDPGETLYVRMYISFGILVGRAHAELVSPAEGSEEIKTLSYTGG